MFIEKDTIATIETLANGKAKLTFYDNGNPVFEKIYNSFTAAKIAQTKLMYKFYK